MDRKYGPAAKVTNDWWTACKNLLSATIFWIYCDLFHHSLSAPHRTSNVTPLTVATRRDWVKFCVPEDNGRPQSDRINLFYFYHNARSEMVAILAKREMTQIRDTVESPAWMTCAFHTGLPAFAFLSTKGLHVPLEVQEAERLAKRALKDGRTGVGWVSLQEDIATAAHT